MERAKRWGLVFVASAKQAETMPRSRRLSRRPRRIAGRARRWEENSLK